MPPALHKNYSEFKEPLCFFTIHIPILRYHIQLSGARTIIAHIQNLDCALIAAEACNIPSARIVVITRGHEDEASRSKIKAVGAKTVEELVEVGVQEMARGAKVSDSRRWTSEIIVAFFCFSSGTTGMPKAGILFSSCAYLWLNHTL